MVSAVKRNNNNLLRQIKLWLEKSYNLYQLRFFFKFGYTSVIISSTSTCMLKRSHSGLLETILILEGKFLYYSLCLLTLSVELGTGYTDLAKITFSYYYKLCDFSVVCHALRHSKDLLFFLPVKAVLFTVLFSFLAKNVESYFSLNSVMGTDVTEKNLEIFLNIIKVK